ncbi:MAG: magnesium transporter [Chloroflexi bacterium]|nr:magnesium transporter [Chloroflexota bacterium]
MVQSTPTRLRDLALAHQPDAALHMLQALSAEERLQALLALPATDLAALLQVLGHERVARLMEHFAPDDAARILLRLGHADAADVLEEMGPDDAADVMEELEPAVARGILIEMDPAQAQEIRRLMAYDPQTAGGIMTPAFVAVYPHVAAGAVLASVRQRAEDAETIYYIYVMDQTQRLLGVLSLRDLVLSPAHVPVSKLMRTEVVKAQVDADQEAAARLLQEHRLLAIPVVDHEGRLMGIITADDVARVVREEVTEDIARLGGSEPLEHPYLRAGVLEIVRKRVGWLLILFIAGAYTSTVLSHFEATLSEVVALSFFIPLLIGTGGNVGSQIVTTLVRAMAVEDVHLGHLLRVLIKEVSVGVCLGAVMAVATFLRAWIQGVDPRVGEVVAVTAIAIVVWASMVAAVLPLTLRRLGVDPAVVSAPFITTLVDGTGLFIYFTLAHWLLRL